MSLTAGTPTRVSNNFNVFEVFGPITISGSYVTNGVALDLTGLCQSNSLPDSVQIIEMPASGAVASGYQYNYAFGTTQANGVVQVLNGAGTQAAQSTFASLGIVSLYYKAVFPKFQ